MMKKKLKELINDYESKVEQLSLKINWNNLTIKDFEMIERKDAYQGIIAKLKDVLK